MQIYLYDTQRVYSGTLDVDPMLAMPRQSTLTAPPTTNSPEVAVWNGNGWIVLAERPPVPGPHIDDAKAAKLREVLTGSDAAMNLITSDYSENEKLSWPKQEAEAKALLADPDAPAPLLRGIADTRGIALTTLRDKVLANVEASEALTALILGTQQKYEDMVKAATTVEEVQAIEVKYGGI